jgi:hypothetical protein
LGDLNVPRRKIDGTVKVPDNFDWKDVAARGLLSDEIP